MLKIPVIDHQYIVNNFDNIIFYVNIIFDLICRYNNKKKN
jgi:hypothetical protein